MAYQLETPKPLSSIYLARGVDEVDEYRPWFTGDVFQVKNSSDMMIMLQHPCSLRIDGSVLEERLLMAQITIGKNHRSDWNKHAFAEMPLPELIEGDDTKYVVSFRHLELVESETFGDGSSRIATLSSHGINLLLQRWIFQNSRVIVPTMTYEEQISGPYNEADLEAEWLSELDGTQQGTSTTFHQWIRESPDGSDIRRQAMLEDPQQRAFVRREMIQEIDRLIDSSG
ncbi:MAG: hypothetical protein L0K41_06290 [Yaniella sp.]|uniref:hypothetical protein n=1 Tax=Yaniella sp. TaxID=2773929 RepID=UPI00264A4714|nr:hypothetical protein [Yaniella sp.]MDN5731040.1 hypothetical protein [Yaniella sp.]MDN5815053.1 hypothetical protein [Yaniella sp.]MDN5817687.1 hypothetical protein [Yaniella sp.]MDN5838192.1 hypothetical protein [Yaniella sp.]MDN5890058.1 hypothetical protein [Yaniella sp.]